MRTPRLLLTASIATAVSLGASSAFAVDASPIDYISKLAALKPGDTLNLAAGVYTGQLNITGLNGTAEQPIVIQGAGDATVFVGDGCCNTVEIVNSSYVTVRNIQVDGKGIDGVFGVSAKNGESNVVHHITIEDCHLVGQGASQQTVGISTKTPTSGWIIRRNVIEGPGTGMYLGNSDHSFPFVGGLIEYNLIKDPIGYDIQIKDQAAWPAHPALPTGDSKTIIRHNVFLKNDQPSPDGARPNLFVGGQPPSGPGANDSVEVYGNLIVHNGVDEPLIQAAGRVSIHDNVLVDASDEALLLTAHDGFPVLRALVYNNTIYGAKRGVVIGSPAMEGDSVIGNLIFADTPVSGATMEKDNVTDAVANAGSYVTLASITPGDMDFYPVTGSAAQGSALDLSMFAGDEAPGCDFNGTSKGDATFRGAYAGSGKNPGWKLAAEAKPPVASCGAGGSGGSGGASTGGGSSGGSAGSATGGASSGGGGSSGSGIDSGGCGCVAAGSTGSREWLFALLSLGVLVWRRAPTARRRGPRNARVSR
ncbi:MAG: right-handed parallel beta-helix repeat-containing protein [Polyangiaceae bacterium]